MINPLSGPSYAMLQPPRAHRWEGTAQFNPRAAEARAQQRKVRWINHRGGPPSNTSTSPPTLDSLRFRDPDSFVAGELHRHRTEWEDICKQQGDAGRQVMQWIDASVDLWSFVRPYKGSFAGVDYDHPTPPPRVFQNSNSGKDFSQFIADTLEERIQNGSVTLLGRTDQVDPPTVVSPLTVEPTKPRLCVNLMYLNCFMQDTPFKLDTLTDVPKLVNKGAYLTSLDDKSSYDHLMLTQASRTLTGFSFQGWYMTLNTIPFGWKNSAFVYQMTNVMAMSTLRRSSILALVYIDDRLMEEYRAHQSSSGKERSQQALITSCELLTRLGFFLSLKKSVLIPTQTITFLGLLTDTVTGSFRVPQAKKDKLATLRKAILSSTDVTLQTLQRFQGKCVSLMLAVPAAKLYIREMSAALATAPTTGGEITLTAALREEISHWEFLDSWDGYVPWKGEHHVSLAISTDSSLFKWGGILHQPKDDKVVSDYWTEKETTLPIMVLEAKALLLSLESFKDTVQNTRVDAQVDNTVLIAAWQNEGCRSREMNDTLKLLFNFTLQYNVTLRLTYVPSADNPADAPSREIRKADCRLTPQATLRVEKAFGGRTGHTMDLMALDSNALVDRQGHPLPHYTPYHTPKSAGVNMYCQKLSPSENYYVFPPYNLIAASIRFLITEGVPFTMVVPGNTPPSPWHPHLADACTHATVVGMAGDTNTLQFPTKKGFRPDAKGLTTTLWAVRVNPHKNNKKTYEALMFLANPLLVPSTPTDLLIVGDSMIRHLLHSTLCSATWSHVFSISGGRTEQVMKETTRLAYRYNPKVLIIHVGINHISRIRRGEYTAMQEYQRATDDMVRDLARLQSSRPHMKMALSSLINTDNSYTNARVQIANTQLQRHCHRQAWKMIKHGYIHPATHLADGLHLNEAGQREMHRHLQRSIIEMLL